MSIVEHHPGSSFLARRFVYYNSNYCSCIILDFFFVQYVFSASELPPSYPIPQHLEMSFLPAPPSHIFFCCLEPPTSSGGETSLCDFRKVYDDMNPEIKQEFEDKGVRN